MIELLDRITKHEIFLEVVQGKLKLFITNKEIDPLLLNEIKNRKEEIIQYLLNNGRLKAGHDYSIKQVPVQNSYPISDAQRRMWILSQFESAEAYNIPNRIFLSQDIDIESFKRAIQSTIERHEILHTLFRTDETGEIRQWIVTKEDLGFRIDYRDFRKAENKQELVETYISEDSYKTFDLEKGPLLRASLLQIKDEEYVFYFNMHHIISDGWSVEVLSKDVLSYYSAYRENKEPVLKPLHIQYKDYSAWQLAQVEEESYQSHKKYWLDNLSGELPLLDLPTAKQRPAIKTYNGRTLGTYLNKGLTQRLKKYSELNGGTLFMTLLATWNVLLYHYTSQKDIIIGTPIAGRDHIDLDDQIGFYVNTLTLRNKINSEESFNAFYKRLQYNTLKSYSHQMYPFDRLVEELYLQRNTSRSAVFDIMLILQNNGEHIQGVDLKKEELDRITDLGYAPSKFDLNISVQEIGDYLSIYVMFNPDVYEREMVEGLINHYRQLIMDVLANPGRKISQIDFLSETEKQKLLVTFNDTDVYFTRKTVVDLFNEQGVKIPNQVAILFGETGLTYQELHEKSNQLARYLKKKYKIKADDRLGIRLERSEWTIITIIAVLKSGGAYVPIDPEYPQKRIDYMLRDSQCKVLIDDQELARFKEEEKKYIKKNVKSITKPGDLAYVIYTSGTTGKPKGVVVEHGSLMNYLTWAQSMYSNGLVNLEFGWFTSLSFDLTVTSIYLPLLSGGTLSVFDSGPDISMVLKTYFESDITCIKLTPAHIKLLKNLEVKHTGIQVAIVGGDALTKAHVETLKALNPLMRVYNEYGPTECTVGCIEAEITSTEDEIRIGKPIANTRIYLLSEEARLQPIGAIGDIYIGGVGLARGYLNKDDLTREKFISSPFKEEERLYKSGDLGRWLSDGSIQYIGRKDNQVKIRGYRIEPGEIEQALQSYKEVEEAVVLTKENEQGEKELVAYITGKTERNTTELRSYLKELLPEYMIPTYFVQLEAMPLTSNGKVDKKSLPDPDGLGIASGIKHVAPRNEIEQRLVKMWQLILRKEKEGIGIDEGFFVAGGNSIKLVALKSQIKKEFGVHWSAALLFKYTTIRQQADMLSKENVVENDATIQISDVILVADEKNSVAKNDDIAVIGMSIKAPGAKNIHEFWKNLRNGIESIIHFSREELLSFGVSEEELDNENYVRSNAYMDEKEYFDSSFFGYVPDEAKMMDPQTRVFHEVVWAALEDSGYDPLSYKGLIGLYAGTAGNAEWEAYGHIVDDGAIGKFAVNHLIDKDYSNSLIANKLNLKGPVHSIHTACSTSLVAVHQAVKSILAAETNIAIAGGISMTNKRKGTGYLYMEGMIFSKDGHNATFDSNSSGTVGGEGAGAVVLKRLSEAIKDGDQIYAIIKGSAINNDGNRKVGYTAPSVDGQSDVIQQAHRISNVKPESISYVEAHGTATKLGDPIEVLALTHAFGERTDKFCALGSVKTNIGHLDTAAGIAGFIKTALCLKHKELVPSLHFKSPNPEINFKESPFYVNTELRVWPGGDSPRRAGVSSFGIGGTNAHVVLEELPAVSSSAEESSLQIITLSAKTNEALERQKEDLRSFVELHKDISVADLAWTLQNKRSFLYRSSFLAQTTDQVMEGLGKAADSQLKNKKTNDRNKKIAFLFPGGGSQYENMGRGLYERRESTFRKTIDHCFEISGKLSDIDFKNILYPNQSGKSSQIYEIVNALPILFMFEYSLAMQMHDYGIKPDIMIGHSMGEYVAACFSRSLTLEGALEISIIRAALMHQLPEGSMMAVEMPADKITGYLSDQVNLAAINSPTGCVISGKSELITELLNKFEVEGITAKLLHIPQASHSIMMEPMLDKFTQAIEHVKIVSPKIPYLSNLTGLQITSKELNDKQYWAAHIRNTVKFSSGINEILSHDNTVLIEVGPGNSLSNFARQHFKKNTSAEVHQLIRHAVIEEDDNRFLLGKIADLWRAGLEIDWSCLNRESVKRKISVPTYSFERIKYPTGENSLRMISERILQWDKEKRLEESEWYYEPSWKKSKLQPTAGCKDSWCLIFIDEDGMWQDLMGFAEMRSYKTLLVKSDREYRKINESEFELNPYDYGGYEKLFTELRTRGIHPANIVHLLSLDQGLQNQDGNIDRNKAFGFYSLLHIAKELNKINDQLPVSISVVTNRMEKVFENEKIQPSKSLMQGLLIVISQESPWIQTKLIDISIESNGKDCLAALVREIWSPVREKFIAYRNETRWIKEFNSLVMPSPGGNESKIRKGGTYLITGGLGYLGFTWSKFLLEKYNANLILIWRVENIDTESASRLRLLQKMGNVSSENINTSDLPSMKKIVENGEKKFGKINGVIHTGVDVEGASFSEISGLSVTECEKQFDLKVNAIQVIEELFRSRELDFCLFASSLFSIIGGKQLGAYASANAYMDHFSQTGMIKNSLSVNFGSLTLNSKLNSGFVFNENDALTPKNLVQVLETVLLAGGIPQLLVSPIKLDYLIKKRMYPQSDRKVEIIEKRIILSEVERSNLSTLYAPPISETEKEVCNLFGEFFGMNEIGIDDNFFELGGDSLKAMTLILRIHKKFNIKFRIKDVFAEASVRNLGKKIDLLTGLKQMKQERPKINFENKIEI